MFFVFTALALWLLLPRFWRAVMAWKQQSEVERSFAVRFTAFSWLLAFVFIVAILFLPNKGRVLLLVPIFLAGMSLAKWWQGSRERLRQKAEAETNFARARRIN
jgi:phosphatidylglycerophosphate synthase